MILGLQPLHLILILAIALLVFGTKPFVKFISSFRIAGDEFRSAMKDKDKRGSNSSGSNAAKKTQ